MLAIVVWMAVNDDGFVSHFKCCLLRAGNQRRTNPLPLAGGQDADWAKGRYANLVARFIDEVRFGIHDIPDDFVIENGDEIQPWNKIWMGSHFVDEIMLVAAWNIEIPKRLSGEFFDFPVIVPGFIPDG